MAIESTLTTLTLPLVFTGGLLGSAHCVGMCGGFAAGIGLGAASLQKNVVRQLVYSFGRVMTYALLGAIGGFAGSWADHRWHHLLNVQATLSLLAGSLLLVQGLWHLGLLPSGFFARLSAGPIGGPVCMVAGQFGQLLRSPGLAPAFVAGVLTAFMPCGLVYANLGLAAGTGQILGGALVMAFFGLGTIPLMVLTGLGAGLATPSMRQRMMKIAAICIFLTGCITLSRAYAGFTAAISPDAIRANCSACIEIQTN
jgi:sulfite exporter TauE/SafE